MCEYACTCVCACLCVCERDRRTHLLLLSLWAFCSALFLSAPLGRHLFRPCVASTPCCVATPSKYDLRQHQAIRGDKFKQLPMTCFMLQAHLRQWPDKEHSCGKQWNVYYHVDDLINVKLYSWHCRDVLCQRLFGSENWWSVRSRDEYVSCLVENGCSRSIKRWTRWEKGLVPVWFDKSLGNTHMQ